LRLFIKTLAGFQRNSDDELTLDALALRYFDKAGELKIMKI